jgi:hypothetical protein
VLARPAKLAVADLVIIVVISWFFLVCHRPQALTVTGFVFRSGQPVMGPERFGGPGGVPGASVVCGALPGPSLRTGDLSTMPSERVFVNRAARAGPDAVVWAPPPEREVGF